MKWRAGILLFLLACVWGLQYLEVMPSQAADETVQKRLIAIADSLHCLVCQEESLSGAHAALAQDLRREISTMIAQGKSDREIVESLLARYSDFVSYHSSNASARYWWWGLFFLLLLAAAGSVIYLRWPSRRTP